MIYANRAFRQDMHSSAYPVAIPIPEPEDLAPYRYFRDLALPLGRQGASQENQTGAVRKQSATLQSVLQTQDASAIEGIGSAATPKAAAVSISAIPGALLALPIVALVEPDGPGFIASAVDLPIYGYGDSMKEAIDALKDEIGSLWEDLKQDDDFSPEWLRYREFLARRINE